MIDEHTTAEALRLYHAEKWRIGSIAKNLGIHHTTVRRILRDEGVPAAARPSRPSMIEPYIPMIKETLRKYPDVTAARLWQMACERSYTGSEGHFRRWVSLLRPRKAPEAFLRLRTLPGEQAQVDWAHFGKLAIGRAIRPLMAFVMVLAWSRRLFVWFCLHQHVTNLLRGHIHAFEHFGGVPRRILYDNPKTIVLERRGDAIRFHPDLLRLAAHHRYEPRPVAVARGNEKGRVERAIRHVRTNFWTAREWRDLDDLNRQALEWCDGVRMARPCPEDPSMTVREAFEKESPHLMPLPATRFCTDERTPVTIRKTPYARFDLNDYSVPHTHVRRTLEVRATPERVRLLDGPEVIADHLRSYDKGQQIEDPAHVAALVAHKAAAREHRGLDRLQCAAPASRDFCAAAAERGHNIGGMVNALNRLLDRYGAAELDAALREALDGGSPHQNTVRVVLERRRIERHQPPPITARFDDPRAHDLAVRPHDLAAYDGIGDDTDGGDDE